MSHLFLFCQLLTFSSKSEDFDGTTYIISEPTLLLAYFHLRRLVYTSHVPLNYIFPFHTGTLLAYIFSIETRLASTHILNVPTSYTSHVLPLDVKYSDTNSTKQADFPGISIDGRYISTLYLSKVLRYMYL